MPYSYNTNKKVCVRLTYKYLLLRYWYRQHITIKHTVMPYSYNTNKKVCVRLTYKYLLLRYWYRQQIR